MGNGGDSQGENSCFHIKVRRGDKLVAFNFEPNTIGNVFIFVSDVNCHNDNNGGILP